MIRQLPIGLRRTLLAVLCALGMTATTLVVAQPAQAAFVQGCTRGFCIDVYTGAKNYSNKTQWVEAVEVYPGNGSVEAWTQNWYRSANSSHARWDVKKWVSTGNGVCGATPDGNGGRKIPCITIRV